MVIAAIVWGSEWKGKSVLIQCDNEAVVSIVNSGSSKNKEAMCLMRCLAFIAASLDLRLRAVHIKGVHNTRADALSRNNAPLFHSLCPQADPEPSVLPEVVLDLLFLQEPDWTSRHWIDKWSSIFRTA